MAILRAFALLLTIARLLAAAAFARRSGGPAAMRRSDACARLAAALGVRVSVEGEAAGAPALLAANHVSWIDVLALRALADFRFLAKSEVGRWPLIGRAARSRGTVFVERARKRSIPPANAAMAERLAQGRLMLMFPQGTTTDALAPPRFLSSHFGCGCDFLAHEENVRHLLVQPAAIFYDSPVAPWLGDAALAPHLWRVLREGPMTCHIRFGEPFALERGFDRKAAAREAARRVEAMLGELRAAHARPAQADAADAPTHAGKAPLAPEGA